jgi:hypothetical protein
VQRGLHVGFGEFAELRHSFGRHISHVRSPSFCIVGFADLPCIKQNAMREAPPNAPEDLRQAVYAMIAHPIRTIVPPWRWKAAACSAVVRALAFLGTNLQSGHSAATKAMLVEAVYAIFVGGPIGAVSQQLRRSKPLWATALLICIGLLGVMTLAQAVIHHFAGTPHQCAGLLVSLCFATLTASYSCYAMRCGAMLGGTEATTVWHDLQSLPRISLDFLLLAPRQLAARLRL